MAIAKAGSLVYAIRGRVGNEVYSVWKGTQMVRALGVAAWAPSAKQIELVGLMADAVTAWKALTSAERVAWDVEAGIQKRRPNSRRQLGGMRSLVPENQTRGSGQMVFIGRYINARRHGFNPPSAWNLLKEEFVNLANWVTGGVGTVDISPAGWVHLEPDASNSVTCEQATGLNFPAQYTLKFKTRFASIGTQAQSNVHRHEIYNGVKKVEFHITSERLYLLKDAGWAAGAPLVTAVDTNYWWQVLVDTGADTAVFYRSTDGVTFTQVDTFNDLKTDAAGDGTVILWTLRGAVGACEVAEDFIYLATGLFIPSAPFVLPAFRQLPEPPTITSVVYAAGTCTVTFTLPPGFIASKHRVGIWIYGGWTVLGEIYRQWKNYQTNPAVLTIAFTTAFVTGNAEQNLAALEDTFLYVQAYICSYTRGAMSQGSNTVEVAIK